MSQENVRTIRALFEAFLRRDAQAMDSLMATEVEWDATRFDRLIPDLAGIYRSAEGTRTFWRTWLSSWKDLRFDYELRASGNDVVALIRNQRQWGHHSGIETEVPPYAWLYTLRGGKVIRACFYPDHESALEAAGLRE
ncbi:MAG: SnoaL-like domain [Solirubrobacterales bacterium]|jgi:ketosteroid isomerase-like protein|nr:SnoaL-like domain [Solirubrobacterales bacterium]